ncbi:hypothetical protein PR202_gb03748 [Eleusine coracana subsp. coracana]|uniref:Uncharacterized protein n=1 Tax=Eleusine coracana subsp. coracana TaxID=191504 RepID=A0AAV5E1R0_ELECO|nr:hypothetical protein QOZ80_1BG0096550 [Eleusine coracana subsp. coracana]GJN16728.1 hypothetical protein PR202_gb03748 [Eleusine coracana subsp. coracana]
MDAAAVLLLLLLLAVAVVLLVRHRTASGNYCPYPNPVLGNLVPLIRNFHRFPDWATDLLGAAPSSTMEVRGPLGVGTGVATADPCAVDHMLRASFPIYVKGTRFAGPLGDLLGRGLFLVDGRLWSLQRKLASHSFSSRSLRRFNARVLRAHLHRRLLPLLADHAAAADDAVVDLQDVLKRFAFDNICSVAFGIDSSTLMATDVQHEAFFKAFDDAVEISFARLFHPTTLVWRAMRLAGVGSERRLRESIAVIDDYVAAMISESAERGNEEEEGHCLLSRFKAAVMEEEEEEREEIGGELGAMFNTPEAKRRFLRDIVVSFVLAGKDSTSVALTWLFWLLAANPRCERRVHHELVQLEGDDDDDEDQNLMMMMKGNRRRMPYLTAAITEAMRLYPPVPINSRVAAAADTLPDGTEVRAGWFADYSAYAMGRMPRLWGSDCQVFRPERWLDDAGEFVAADAARYPVFHAGPRACLGKEMAYVQMKAVAAAVIRRFKVETVRPATMDKPPPYKMAVTLRMKDGLPVRIRRRE